MDTQDTGTTEEQSSTEQTDENATSATSKDGENDADTRRIEDKQEYLKQLDREIKEAEALRNKTAKKGDSETEDDVMTWLTVNADSLKLVTKEYQEELAFYKSHKIPVTNDIRDRALRDAKTRKGVRSGNVDRTASTSTEVAGEMRKPASTGEIPDEVKKLNPKLTKEKYQKYKAEFEATAKR